MLLGAIQLCWALLPLAWGIAEHRFFMRVSHEAFQTDISDLFSEMNGIKRITKVPLMEHMDGSEGAPILDSLPFVKKRMAKKGTNHGLFLNAQLTLVEDLLSGKSLPLVEKVIQAGGLVIEDVKGPEVTVLVLSDSLLQITLRFKLYLSLKDMLRVELIKNIRVGVRMERDGNQTQIFLEECNIPPGYLSIKVLKQLNIPLINEALKIVTKTLDTSLPYLLQKQICPMLNPLLNKCLKNLLELLVDPTPSGDEDFKYYITSMNFTKDGILMEVLLITPCNKERHVSQDELFTPLPPMMNHSMFDLILPGQVYNDILSCLYVNKSITIHAASPRDSSLTYLLSQKCLHAKLEEYNQLAENLELIIKVPNSPIIYQQENKTEVIQTGILSLVDHSPCASVEWDIHLLPYFSVRNGKLELQLQAKRDTFNLEPDTIMTKEYFKIILFDFLKQELLPHENEWLQKQALPLPGIKGINFNQAMITTPLDYLLLSVL